MTRWAMDPTWQGKHIEGISPEATKPDPTICVSRHRLFKALPTLAARIGYLQAASVLHAEEGNTVLAEKYDRAAKEMIRTVDSYDTTIYKDLESILNYVKGGAA